MLQSAVLRRTECDVFCTVLQVQNLLVIWYIQITVVVLDSFCQVPLFTAVNGTVFGMPQNQIRNLKLAGKLTGVFDRAVVFFVGFKDFPFTVQAKCLMKEPVASLYKRTADRIIRLIAGAG